MKRGKPTGVTWPGVVKPVEPTIKVTFIKDRWHARLLSPDKSVIDEMACDDRRSIRYICRTMLRWYSKMGQGGPYAERSRHRDYGIQGADGPGKIWWQKDLEEEQQQRAAALANKEG